MILLKQHHISKSPTDNLSCITSNGGLQRRWGIGSNNQLTVDSSKLSVVSNRCVLLINKGDKEVYIAGVYSNSGIAIVTKDSKEIEVREISKWIYNGKLIKTKV